MNATNVKLGATTYKTPHLNLGEIEEIDLLFHDKEIGKLKRSFQILAVMLRRAAPSVADVMTIEAKPEEVGAAIAHILEFSGLKTVEGESDPNRSAPAAG